MLFQERLGGERAKILQRRAQSPHAASPTRRARPCAGRLRGESAPLDRPCRHAGDDRIRRDVARDDRARADRRRRCRSVTPGSDRRAMADPDVMADGDGVFAPPVEEAFFARGVRPIIVGAVGEVMQRRAPSRMIGAR